MVLEKFSYFDEERRKADFSIYQVSKLEAMDPDTVVFHLRHSDYSKFCGQRALDSEATLSLILNSLPGLEQKGQNRKRIIVEQFNEVVSTDHSETPFF